MTNQPPRFKIDRCVMYTKARKKKSSEWNKCKCIRRKIDSNFAIQPENMRAHKIHWNILLHHQEIQSIQHNTMQCIWFNLCISNAFLSFGMRMCVPSVHAFIISFLRLMHIHAVPNRRRAKHKNLKNISDDLWFAINLNKLILFVLSVSGVRDCPDHPMRIEKSARDFVSETKRNAKKKETKRPEWAACVLRLILTDRVLRTISIVCVSSISQCEIAWIAYQSPVYRRVGNDLYIQLAVFMETKKKNTFCICFQGLWLAFYVAHYER